MKLLSDILYKSGIVEVKGPTNITVASMCFDSRKVGSGCLFIAIRGAVADGHNFIQQAVNAGAAAIVCEDFPKKQNNKVTYVKVRNSSVSLGHIASNFYNNPSSQIILTGITGTNGKTTVATLLYKLFQSLGYKSGLISTVRNYIDGEVSETTLTTPDAIHINHLLRKMVDKKCTHCFMEASSHSIVQHRITGLDFAAGVFTNITPEHLDYHKTFDEYITAKKLFFDMLGSESFALINKDDRHGAVMLQNTKASKKTMSMKSFADFRCKVIESMLNGLFLNIDGNEVWTKLTGNFNAYNLLSVYATAVLLNQEKLNVLTSLSMLEPVEGRFECLKPGNGITGIIDFAHTPDALINVLETIDRIRTKNETLITIVGCGGDRDTQKRPVMANIACEHSNKVILTSDNPRSENPEQIIREMQKGVEHIHINKVLSITDRREAIKTACMLAKPGDIILIAGKGHEKYQEIKGVKHPFDDKQIFIEACNLINNLNN